MSHPVSILIFHSRLFPAHWNLWIPSKNNEKIGKLIHATGDAAVGFEHEIMRDYNLAITRRSHQLVFLATVDDKYIVDTPNTGTRHVDTKAVDDIERRALSIPTPGPSLASASSSSSSSLGGKKVRVEIQNCQTWLRQVTVALIDDGIFPQEALSILDGAPKN